jgi:hypothetical protein
MEGSLPQISPGARYLGCAVVALLALVGTWGHNIAYLPAGFVGANLQFWQDTLQNPAARSITFDLFALVIPVMVWMFAEARRLAMPGIWLYVIASILVAISVAFPVFLMHRTLVQQKRGELAALQLSLGDKVGLAVLSALALTYLLWSFGWLG